MPGRWINLISAMGRYISRDTRAAINPAWFVALFSIVAIALLGALLLRTTGHKGARPEGELVVFCAAGIKPPAEAAAKDYEKEYGIPVQLQYGGSGTLLSISSRATSETRSRRRTGRSI